MGHPGLTVLRLVALAACLTFAIMLATAPPREAPRVGTIGAGCSYELDERTGTLAIRPTDGCLGRWPASATRCPTTSGTPSGR